MLAPLVDLCVSVLHVLISWPTRFRHQRFLEIRAFSFATPYYWQIHIMCQLLMTAALTEWGIHFIESSWIHFKLHWIKVSATPSARQPKTTVNFWHRSVAPGDQICVRSHNHSLAKASVNHEFDCRSLQCFLCACSRVYVFHWGLFLRVKLCQISSQIWASEFDTKCAFFFCFCQI